MKRKILIIGSTNAGSIVAERISNRIPDTNVIIIDPIQYPSFPGQTTIEEFEPIKKIDPSDFFPRSKSKFHN